MKNNINFTTRPNGLALGVAERPRLKIFGSDIIARATPKTLGCGGAAKPKSNSLGSNVAARPKALGS